MNTYVEPTERLKNSPAETWGISLILTFPFSLIFGSMGLVMQVPFFSPLLIGISGLLLLGPGIGIASNWSPKNRKNRRDYKNSLINLKEYIENVYDFKFEGTQDSQYTQLAELLAGLSIKGINGKGEQTAYFFNRKTGELTKVVTKNVPVEKRIHSVDSVIPKKELEGNKNVEEKTTLFPVSLFAGGNK